MYLIDADIDVSDYIEIWDCQCSEAGTQTVMVVEDLQYLPRIDPVHAAGACYCKECIQSKHDRGELYCVMFRQYRDNNDFCSYGKREEGGYVEQSGAFEENKSPCRSGH